MYEKVVSQLFAWDTVRCNIPASGGADDRHISAWFDSNVDPVQDFRIWPRG